MAKTLKILWPLLIPLVIFLPGLMGFAYPPAEGAYSDLTISHYPNTLYLRRALFEQGSIPLWSPQILSGHPFAANPLSGLWYPPGWLALLLPLPLGFNLLVMLHLLWGGVGLFALLRREGLSAQAALFGGVAFVALPKLYAHYGAGHLTLLYAIPWTPWLLWSAHRRGWLEAAVLGLIFLADPRWAAYAGLVWWGYEFAHSQKGLRAWMRKGLDLLGRTLLAGLVAAPLTLPLMEYTRVSTRAHLTVADALVHSLPPARLLGFIYPDLGGNHEWMLYSGGVGLTIMVVAFLARRRAKMMSFWVLAFLIALLFSLGEHFFLAPWLVRLPGFNLLRVPARALFIAGIAGASLAAYGLDGLLHGLDEESRRRTALGLTALSGFSIIFALALGWMTGQWAPSFLWGAGVLLLASLWVQVRLQNRLSTQLWLAGLFLLAFLDWGALDRSLLRFRPPEDVLGESAGLVDYLTAQPGDFRIYSPSYSLPQHTAAYAGLQLADGVDPLQLADYAAFLGRASGVPDAGYSVTLPPFAAGAPSSANMEYTPDAALLGWLHVGHVVAEYDIRADGLQLLEQIDGTRVYKNLLARPHAWVQPFDAASDEEIHAAQLTSLTPNRICVQADGPGLLVLSELAYPGWVVEVDGQPAEIETAVGILRAVSLDSGTHEVMFEYRPASLYWGLGLCLVGILIIGSARLKNGVFVRIGL